MFIILFVGIGIGICVARRNKQKKEIAMMLGDDNNDKNIKFNKLDETVQ